MDRTKFPELAKRFDELSAERDKVMASVAPLQAEANNLQVTSDAAASALSAVRKKIAKIEKDGNLKSISMERAALARAMGALGLKAEPAK